MYCIKDKIKHFSNTTILKFIKKIDNFSTLMIYKIEPYILLNKHCYFDIYLLNKYIRQLWADHFDEEIQNINSMDSTPRTPSYV